MQPPTRFPLADLARVKSATHEIATIHRSLDCPAVWSKGACTCADGLRYAIRRLPKARAQ